MLVPAGLLVRVAGEDVAVQVVGEPEETFPAVVSRAGHSGRMQLHVDAAAAPHGELRYFLRVLVAANRPASTFSLELRGEQGEVLGRCRFAPGGYRVDRHWQTTLLACPARGAGELRSVLVEARTPRTPASIRVRRRPDGGLEAGGLLAPAPGGHGAALDRLSAARPRLFGAPTLLAAAGLSWGLLGAGAALGLGLRVRREDARPDARGEAHRESIV